MAQEIDRGKRHEPDKIDQGLIYLALNYGKARKASRKMEEDGVEPIAPSTLDYWKKAAYPERYERLRQEMEKRRDLNAAERMDALIARSLELQERVLDEADEKLGTIPAKDLPSAYKNFAIGSGVLQDKSDRIKGKPAGVIEHRVTMQAIEAGLRELGVLAETNAPIDAEVVEEDAVS